jgi:hypothetical protein
LLGADVLCLSSEALTLFDGWLKELQEHKIPIPQNFDLAFFSEAFQVMLEAEHHQILSRILSLL